MLYRTEYGEYVIVYNSSYIYLKPTVWNFYLTSKEYHQQAGRVSSAFHLYALGWMSFYRDQPIPCIRRSHTIPLENKQVCYDAPNVSFLSSNRKATTIPATWYFVTEVGETKDTKKPICIYQNTLGDYFMLFGTTYVPLIAEGHNYVLRPDEFEEIKDRVNETFDAFARCWMHQYPQRPIPVFVSNYRISTDVYFYDTPSKLTQLANNVPDNWTYTAYP